MLYLVSGDVITSYSKKTVEIKDIDVGRPFTDALSLFATGCATDVSLLPGNKAVLIFNEMSIKKYEKIGELTNEKIMAATYAERIQQVI